MGQYLDSNHATYTIYFVNEQRTVTVSEEMCIRDRRNDICSMIVNPPSVFCAYYNSCPAGASTGTGGVLEEKQNRRSETAARERRPGARRELTRTADCSTIDSEKQEACEKHVFYFWNQ